MATRTSSGMLLSTIDCFARECRWVIKLIGLYLIPWARCCDRIAFDCSTRWLVLRTCTWYLAVLLLSLIVAVHLAVICAIVQYNLPDRGLLTPCVCEAIVQPFRHETAYIVFATGHMFRDVYAVFQAFSLFVYVLVSLATGLMSLMWHNSKECLIALVVWIMLRSQT